MTETSRKPPDRGLVITVSGFHGSGRTTHAKRLARAFGLRYVSSGTIFRQMAEERGMTLEEMSRLTEEGPELDRLIDERAAEESRRGGVVVDATLSGWVCHEPDLRIFLTAPLDTRIMRIARREGVGLEETRAETLARTESERERFKKYYDIDISDTTIYDLVLNTGLFDADGTARILKSFVEEYCSGG